MNQKNIQLNAMIVEDEEELCFLLSRVLMQKNLKPSCAYTIAEAKNIIDQINPCILFLDNSLPDGFGIDFITVAKDRFPSIKIVMITAHDSSEDIKRAIKNGADYFISKPFSSAVINNTIDSLASGKMLYH